MTKSFSLHTPPCPTREMLLSKKQHVPGSLDFNQSTYALLAEDVVSEKGEMSYSYSEQQEERKFHLRFCIRGSRYCTKDNCIKCRLSKSADCSNTVNTIDLFTMTFYPDYLMQFAGNNFNARKNSILSFSATDSFHKTFHLTVRNRELLGKLQQSSYCTMLQNVTFNAVMQELLLNSLDDEKPEVFSCRFLADATAREKMYEARNILLENIDSLISIKELSRKVAINECYLKKGFKEVFGVTIYDFYLQQKMEHAKFLLYEEGMTVTDVSAQLGYSSISHFSTAFKRQTGLKPCDLLR